MAIINLVVTQSLTDIFKNGFQFWKGIEMLLLTIYHTAINMAIEGFLAVAGLKSCFGVDTNRSFLTTWNTVWR